MVSPLLPKGKLKVTKHLRFPPQNSNMAMAFKMATTGMWVTDEYKNSFMEMKWKRCTDSSSSRSVKDRGLSPSIKSAVPEKVMTNSPPLCPKTIAATPSSTFDFVTDWQLPQEQDLLHRMVSNSIKDKSKDTICNIQGWAEKSAGWHCLWATSNWSYWDGIWSY